MCYSDPHLPVLGLVDPLGVGPCEATLAVERCDGGAELRHGVEVGGEVVQHGDHMGGESSSFGPFFGQPADLQDTNTERSFTANPYNFLHASLEWEQQDLLTEYNLEKTHQ